MSKWTNGEKIKVVREAADLIVKDGWDKAYPENALYHAQYRALPMERCHAREKLLEESGWGMTLMMALNNRIAVVKKQSLTSET